MVILLKACTSFSMNIMVNFDFYRPSGKFKKFIISYIITPKFTQHTQHFLNKIYKNSQKDFFLYFLHCLGGERRLFKFELILIF